MTAHSRSAFRLETRWTPGGDDELSTYDLTLTNNSGANIKNFTLCVSGPGRIDAGAAITGGRLVSRLSNHTQLAPTDGFDLTPGASWTVSARGMNFPLRHWNDGANSAYLALENGTTAPVAVARTQAKGQNATLKRGSVVYPVPGKVPVAISVIPWPERVAVKGNRSVPAGLALVAGNAETRGAAEAFAALSEKLFPAEGMVRPVAEGGMEVELSNVVGMGAETYRVVFEELGVRIEASDHAGLVYGLITLGQIWRGAKQYPEQFSFPQAGEITDAPAFAWRGSHLDVSRQFYTTSEIKRFLALLAWNKMNRFHWHLSDDEAWRVEIDAYPELTEIGAWRGHGLPLPPLLGSGPERWGGYYTKAAIREVVAEAARLGIEVVPEIDIPGHCYAVLKALPWLSDPDEPGYQSVQGFPNNCLNPALEATYTFIETVFDELIALFPFETIHVGADEVPLAAWSGSPLALKKLAEVAGDELAEAHAKLANTIGNLHGADEIEGSGAAVLQAIFIERVHKFLASRGCITGGWEEAAHGNVIDKDKSYLVGWRTTQASAALAGEGYKVVVSPGQAYYLDMSQGTEWSEPGASWAGWSSVEKTYLFDPAEGWTGEQRQRLMGVQACIWSESMTDRAIFDRLVFPRLSAIAETGWTRPEARSFKRFTALCGLMPILYGNWGEAEPV